MTTHLDLIDPDTWNKLRPKIAARRQELLEGLAKIDAASLRYYQGIIAGLDWVVEEAAPPKPAAPIPTAPEDDDPDDID